MRLRRMNDDSNTYQGGRSVEQSAAWPSAPAPKDLARCFMAAIAESSLQNLTSLKTAVSSLAEAMRAQCVPPEKSLIHLKRMLRSGGGPGWTPTLVTRVCESPSPMA